MARCGTLWQKRRGYNTVGIERGGDHLGITKDNDYLEQARAYVARCRAAAEGKKAGRFPNMAGFCRYIGMGVEAFQTAMAGREEEMDRLMALFEDEALNCDLSATLVSAYLKKHLGYGEKSQSPRGSCNAEGVRLVFDHDIWEDGG